MISYKKKMEKIGDLVRTLTSINVVIMLAVMLSFTATDSYGKKGPEVDPNSISSFDGDNDGGEGTKFHEEQQLAPLPIGKGELTLVKVAAAKNILGKFYLNKATIEAALSDNVEITLPGAIVLDKLPDAQGQSPGGSDGVGQDGDQTPPKTKSKLKKSKNIVAAMQEFYKDIFTDLQPLIITQELGGLKKSDVSTQDKFNKVMGKILLKSFESKKNILFKSPAYIDLVYESEFIKDLVKHFRNNKLADGLDENANAQTYMTQLVENNLLHFALKEEKKKEGQFLVLEISFSVNSSKKPGEVINLNNIKASLSEFVSKRSLDNITVFILQKLLDYITAKASVANASLVSGKIPMKKIGTVSATAAAADQVYVMVFKDSLKNKLLALLELQDNFLDEAKTLQEFFYNLVNENNQYKLRMGISELLTVLQSASPEQITELLDMFVKDVVLGPLNKNKTDGNSYAAGSLMLELVKAIGKEAGDVGGDYAAYSLEEYIGLESSGDSSSTIAAAISQFKSEVGLTGDYVKILAKGGHQKRFASLAKSIVDSLKSPTKRMDLALLLIKHPDISNNAKKKLFNLRYKSISPAIYFGVTARELALASGEQSYLYKPDRGGASYIQFNSIEERILGKLMSVVNFDTAKKIRLSVLSSTHKYRNPGFNLAALGGEAITSNAYSTLNTLNSELNRRLGTADSYVLGDGNYLGIDASPNLVVAGTLSDMINVKALQREFGNDVIIEYVFGAGNNYMWMQSKNYKSLGKSALTDVNVSLEPGQTGINFTYTGLYNLLSGRILYKLGENKVNISSLGTAAVNGVMNDIGEVLPFLIDPSPGDTAIGTMRAKSIKITEVETLLSQANNLNKPGSYMQAAVKFEEVGEKYWELGDHEKSALAYANVAAAKISHKNHLKRSAKPQSEAAVAINHLETAWAYDKEASAWAHHGDRGKAAEARAKQGDTYALIPNFPLAAWSYEKAAENYKLSNLPDRVAKAAEMHENAAEQHEKDADNDVATLDPGKQTMREKTYAAWGYRDAAKNYALAGNRSKAFSMREKQAACENKKGNCLPVTAKPIQYPLNGSE